MSISIHGRDRSPANVPEFSGEIYYVDAAQLDDTGGGITQDDPKKTIGAAITIATAGDAISIRAGTYTENVVINKNSMEIWPEIGTIITPASGTPLLVSANYCNVHTEFGVLRANPATGETGVEITGNWNYVWNVRVPCASLASIGYDITGDGNVLTDCRTSDPKIAAFKVQGDKNKLKNCLTGGSVAGSKGFWFTNSCDKSRLRECTSQGHSGGGFVVDSGCTNGEAFHCGSGGGDGARSDPDHAFVWSGYTFDAEVYKELILDGDSETKAYNLYTVTGIVQIDLIYAHVEASLSTNHTDCHIDLYDGSTSVNLSDPTGLALSAAPEGSLIIRNAAAASMLGYSSGAAGFLSENADYKLPQKSFIAGQKGDGTTTYIRFVHTTTDSVSSGTLHWHIHYKPITDSGFIEAV